MATLFTSLVRIRIVLDPTHLRPTTIWIRQFSQTTRHSQISGTSEATIKESIRHPERSIATQKGLPPHAIFSTKTLLRSYLVNTVLSTPILFTPAVKILSFLMDSKSPLFSVERNPILHFPLKKLFYEHFCAGENAHEVKNTIDNIKSMGFRGVILTYAREIVVDASINEDKTKGMVAAEEGKSESREEFDSSVESWRSGVLETLSMLSDGDYLALKLTGAGATVMQRLSAHKALPMQMMDALGEICEGAIAKRVKVLVDAEQRSVQPGIDDVAVELMKKYNKNDTAVLFNTYQAYLKNAPQTLMQHLKIAREENFRLGVKLVRGAYIKSEPRHLIHDTKQQTDDCYNSLAEGLLQKQYIKIDPSVKESEPFPTTTLFLGTHNKESAISAWEIQQAQVSDGKQTIPVHFGQLLGMADEVSGRLLQLKGNKADGRSPEVYKCLSWGTLGDCLSYLLRRAMENKDAVTRTKAERKAVQAEIFRRVKGAFRLG